MRQGPLKKLVELIQASNGKKSQDENSAVGAKSKQPYCVQEVIQCQREYFREEKWKRLQIAD